MDQSEIDALLKSAASPKQAAKPVSAAPAEASKPASPPPAPIQRDTVVVAPPTPTSQAIQRDKEQGHVISELDTVTEVTERETIRVMDKLDVICQLVTQQQRLIDQMQRNQTAQDPAIQSAIQEIYEASSEIQNRVFEAMDLMQFQDITRQKLERIVHHLRQIHDYIVDLLGTGLKSDGQRASISHTIASATTSPDERKAYADSVVEEFLKQKTGG